MAIRQISKDIYELIRDTFRKAAADDTMTQGAAIAFYTIFSIAPLLILIVSVSGFFLSEEMIAAQIDAYLIDFLDEEAAENLNQFIAERGELPGSFWTSLMATGLILFGATTVINQLKLTLNRIWKVREVKIHSAWQFLINRLLSFGMIILFSLLLIISLMAEAVVGIISAYFMELLPGIPIDFYQMLSRMTTIGFAVIFFTLIFQILPDVHAPWKDVLIGAVVTTLLFMLGKYLIGLYLSSPAIATTYRAAGTLVVLVIWVYYNIQTILLGAVFTQVYTERFGGRILPYKFVELKEMSGFG